MFDKDRNGDSCVNNIKEFTIEELLLITNKVISIVNSKSSNRKSLSPSLKDFKTFCLPAISYSDNSRLKESELL